jgi:hypothetical protein
MVWVNVWVCEGDDPEEGHCFEPVVALRSQVVRTYGKRLPPDSFPDDGGTEKDLQARGWYLQSQDEDLAGIIPSEDAGGLIAHNDEYLKTSNSAGRLVAAPWNPSEDEVRLAPVVAELTQTVRNLLYCRRMRETPPDSSATAFSSSDTGDIGVAGAKSISGARTEGTSGTMRTNGTMP